LWGKFDAQAGGINRERSERWPLIKFAMQKAPKHSPGRRDFKINFWLIPVFCPITTQGARDNSQVSCYSHIGIKSNNFGGW